MAEPSKQPPSELELQHDAAEEKILQVVRWALPLTSLLAAIAVGSIYGVGTAILVLAGGVLLGVIAILWASVRTLAGDAPITLEEAIALGSPSTAEEQKRAVLQALKDLEYERSMGKISEPDYEELVVRYRAEAKRLLKAVDQDLAPLRARAAAYVEKELGRTRPAAAKEPTIERKKQLVHSCPSCQTENDADAVFCKKCGGKLAGAAKDQQDATV